VHVFNRYLLEKDHSRILDGKPMMIRASVSDSEAGPETKIGNLGIFMTRFAVHIGWSALESAVHYL
jgi:hypothetical protein